VYRPFGEVHVITGSASNNLRFPGQYFLIEAGLHYNWHRHSDPTVGRYLQADPLEFVDGRVCMLMPGRRRRTFCRVASPGAPGIATGTAAYDVYNLLMWYNDSIMAVGPLTTEYLLRAGYSQDQISRFAENTRLFQDMGLWGDNADDDLKVLGHEFGVDMSSFRFKKYFPTEFGANRLLAFLGFRQGTFYLNFLHMD
jgi:RHS repeat-associated protein